MTCRLPSFQGYRCDWGMWLPCPPWARSLFHSATCMSGAWFLPFFLFPPKKILYAKHITKQYRLIKSCGRAARQALRAPLTAKLTKHLHHMYGSFLRDLPSHPHLWPSSPHPHHKMLHCSFIVLNNSALAPYLQPLLVKQTPCSWPGPPSYKEV